MKTTIDIPENILKEVIFYSKAKTQRAAILTAMEEYIQHRKMQNIANRLGQFENFITQKDLKKMREDK